MKLNIIIEKDTGGYFAFCPALKGCHTQGDTFEEVLSNIREAAELYIETLPDEQKDACSSKEIVTTTMEIGGVA